MNAPLLENQIQCPEPNHNWSNNQECFEYPIYCFFTRHVLYCHCNYTPKISSNSVLGSVDSSIGGIGIGSRKWFINQKIGAITPTKTDNVTITGIQSISYSVGSDFIKYSEDMMFN